MLSQWIKASTSIALSFFLLTSCQPQESKDTPELTPIDTIPAANLFLDIPIDSLEKQDFTIKQGDYLGKILGNYNVTAQRIDSAGKQQVFDVTKMRVGHDYTALTTAQNELHYFIYHQNKQSSIVFDLRDSLRVYEYSKPIFYQSKTAKGTITSSLWNAIVGGGYDIELSGELASLYEWQIDFFGIAKGDSFKALYEEAVLDDSTSLYIERIKGASFTHQGETYLAIPFKQDGVVSYFDEKGQSLRKAFLKAPLRYTRISSGFSHARRHPILKIVRPHHGVDYAAPTGTPVQTIGDGVVITKAYQRGGAGYYLKIKHHNNYVTTYMHLSRYAKGIQVGSAVKQGDVIAYVGSTGGSTGPHLDFRVHHNGTPINPLKMKSPPTTPIKPELMDSFNIVRDEIIRQLDTL